MKKKYITPKIDTQEWLCKDIIMASGVFEWFDNGAYVGSVEVTDIKPVLK